MDNEKRSVEELDFTVLHWSHQQRAELFLGDAERLDSLTIKEQDDARSYATGFEEDSDGKPMARTAVLIPVAAAQDSGLVYHTLGEYAKQQGNDPFTIFLSLNAAASQGDVVHDDAWEEGQRARADFPELDVRIMMPSYQEPTIGKIRRDLWNAAYLLAYNEGLFEADDGEVIGISNDIDTEYISPHYIARIQQHYKRRQAKFAQIETLKSAIMPPATTRLTHAVYDSHPHVGMVTKWVDNTYFQAYGGYEAGSVIPFMHYARSGGFNADDVTYETRPLLHPDPNDTTPVAYIPGAQLYTSPRRYIDRLSQGFTQNEIWSDETFSHNDDCRDELKPDITKERAEQLILERVENDIQDFWIYRPFDKFLKPLIDESWQKRFKQKDLSHLSASEEHRIRNETAAIVTNATEKAARLMETYVGSETLARIIREDFDTTDLIGSLGNYALSAADPLRGARRRTL